MKDIELMLPSVLTKAPTCPEPTAIASIRQAAIEFCVATRAWRAYDEFEATKDNCSFVCAPTNGEVYEFESVLFNGKQLEHISISELEKIMPRWRERENSPHYYTQEAFDTITIVPKDDGHVKIHMFARPSEEAEQLPDFLLDKYRHILADGALSHILMIPGQPFFSAEMASYYAVKFQRALDRHFNLNVRGQQRAPTRTTPQYF